MKAAIPVLRELAPILGPLLTRSKSNLQVAFLSPIHVGDVVEVDSEVTFTSERSCEVCVTIEAMSIMK